MKSCKKNFFFFHVYCPVLHIITIQYIKGIIKYHDIQIQLFTKGHKSHKTRVFQKKKKVVKIGLASRFMFKGVATKLSHQMNPYFGLGIIKSHCHFCSNIIHRRAQHLRSSAFSGTIYVYQHD